MLDKLLHTLPRHQNDRLLCVLSLCILVALVAMRGVATLLHAESWQLLELAVLIGSGLLSLSRSTWYTRNRETILLVRWAVTILVGTAAATPKLASTPCSTSTMLALNAYLLFAAAAPLRFSTLMPLLVLNMLATASTVPMVCVCVCGALMHPL